MAKLIGLGLVGLSLVYALLAWRAKRKGVRILLTVLATAFWGASFIAFAGLLFIEHYDSTTPGGGLLCPVPGRDSVYADTHWSWLPPGEVCEFAVGDVGPTYWRVPALTILLGLPTIVVVAEMRRVASASPEPIESVPVRLED